MKFGKLIIILKIYPPFSLFSFRNYKYVSVGLFAITQQINTHLFIVLYFSPLFNSSSSSSPICSTAVYNLLRPSNKFLTFYLILNIFNFSETMFFIFRISSWLFLSMETQVICVIRIIWIILQQCKQFLLEYCVCLFLGMPGKPAPLQVVLSGHLWITPFSSPLPFLFYLLPSICSQETVNSSQVII